MPIYDYLCASCGRLTEFIHGIEAPGPRFCPACGAEGTLRKAFAPPTVHFKGSGWAKKDRSATRAARTKPAADGDGSADRSDGKAPAGEGSTETKAGDGTSSATSGGSSDAPKAGGKDSGKRASGGSTAEA